MLLYVDVVALRGEVDPLCGATVNLQPLALITPLCQRMLRTCYEERQTCTGCVPGAAQ